MDDGLVLVICIETVKNDNSIKICNQKTEWKQKVAAYTASIVSYVRPLVKVKNYCHKKPRSIFGG